MIVYWIVFFCNVFSMYLGYNGDIEVFGYIVYIKEFV